uniref:Uncharacterized protein n=1 Tax=Ascaris lumbricoides TaxID=6252 RepID=A0A0M3I211_ASCLU
MKLPESVTVFIFSVFIRKLDADKYTRREDLLLQNFINSTSNGPSNPIADERTSNETFDTIEEHPICRWVGFFMIIFYAALVFLIVLLDGLIPRIREHFRIMEPSDSFAADEVRPVPHNLPPMQIAQMTPFSPVSPTSVAPPSSTEQ